MLLSKQVKGQARADLLAEYPVEDSTDLFYWWSCSTERKERFGTLFYFPAGHSEDHWKYITTELRYQGFNTHTKWGVDFIDLGHKKDTWGHIAHWSTVLDVIPICAALTRDLTSRAWVVL